MERLHQAVATGLRQCGWFRTEAGPDLLRNRPDFQLLMIDLAFPDEPFARPE
jgi:hypothetical protein